MNNWNDEQLQAIDLLKTFITSKEWLFVLKGYAGTGKTTLIQYFINDFLSKQNIEFTLCAPTHRAAIVLANKLNYEVITLHKLLALSPDLDIFHLDLKDLKFKAKGKNFIPENSLIIIDESSMISNQLYKLLYDLCDQYNNKIIAVGDSAQIQSVGDDNISKIFSCPNSYELTKIHRQNEESGLLPTLFTLRNRFLKKFSTIEDSEGSLFVYNNTKDFMIKCSDFVRNAILTQDMNYVKLIAYENSRVSNLNKCIRKLVWDNNNIYNKYEILTGYENLEYNKVQFYNSLDYIVIDKPKMLDRKIPQFLTLPGFELSLYNNYDKTVNKIFILDQSKISSDIFYSLAQKIESIRLTALEKQQYSKYSANFLWKQYFSIFKSFATPIDLYWDNRLIKKKTFDYGYALTNHKVQGGGFNNVFVDMKNTLTCKDENVLRQMQYVALSRTTKDVYMLQ